MRLGRSRGLINATVPVVIVMIACARGADPVDLGGQGEIGDAALDRLVLPVPDTDSAVPGSDGGARDSGADVTAPSGTHVVINEIQTAGSGASSELVELYNPTSSEVSLANWEVRYASSGGGAGTAGHKFNGAASIPANGYLVLKPSDNTWMAGMQATAGQVGLFDGTGSGSTLIDGVGYGTGSGGIVYREGQSAPSPPSGGSIGRSPNGVDTGNNKNDFRTYTVVSAGSPNP